MTTKVQGSSGIQFPDATQQVTAAKVRGLFSAKPAVVQQFAPNTTNDAKINLGTENVDSEGWFSASRYTPQIAGWYQISGCIWYSGSVGIKSVHALLMKNGTQMITGQFLGWMTVGNSGQIVSFSGLVYLNGTTDYVELWGSANSTATVEVLTDTTNFGGYLLKADQ